MYSTSLKKELKRNLYPNTSVRKKRKDHNVSLSLEI